MIEPSDAEPGVDVDVREAPAIRRAWRQRWLGVPIVAAVALGAVAIGSDQGSSLRRLESGPLPPPLSAVNNTADAGSDNSAASVFSSETTSVGDGEAGTAPATLPPVPGAAGNADGNVASGSTGTTTTTTTTTTTVPAATVAPITLISVGLAAPDPAAVDAMLGFDSVPEAVAEALQLSPSTAWIENTRVARVFLNVVPYLWQVGDGASLVATRDEGWQGRLARAVAEDLVSQGFWYADPQAWITDPVFHAETGFADVRVGGVGQVTVGPDALVYVMTPAEWRTTKPSSVPPMLASLWRVPEVEAAGLVVEFEWSTRWTIVGLGAAELSAAFVGPASLDQRRVLAALCGAGTPIVAVDGGEEAVEYLGCERDGTTWDIGVETFGPETRTMTVLRLTRGNGGTWPYVGATGPDL